jgi:hypothetical protein
VETQIPFPPTSIWTGRSHERMIAGTIFCDAIGGPKRDITMPLTRPVEVTPRSTASQFLPAAGHDARTPCGAVAMRQVAAATPSGSSCSPARRVSGIVISRFGPPIASQKIVPAIIRSCERPVQMLVGGNGI